MARIRERTTAHPAGTRVYLGNTLVKSGYPNYERTEDISTNPGGNNPFSNEKFDNRPIYWTFYQSAANWATRYPLQYFHTKQVNHPTHTKFLDATQAIASSHPGQPAVSLPNFLYEFKDVPGLLRHAADRARKLHMAWIQRGQSVSHRKLAKYYSTRNAGEDWLNYQFGWVPFFSDLADIINLDKYLRHRLKKYSSIKNEEIRTTGSLGSSEINSGPLAVATNSTYGSFTGDRYTWSTQERWFSATWQVNQVRFGEALNSGTLDTLQDALGLDGAFPIQFWEALPWSWLSDWFLNVGALMTLKMNRQGVSFKRACIMSHTTTKLAVYPRTEVGSQNLSRPGIQTLETKSRVPFSPTFTRQEGLNILGPSQLATLASLKVTKLKGSSTF